MRLVLVASKFAGIAVRPLGSGAPEKARRWPLAMVVAVSDFGCWGGLRQGTLRLRLTRLQMNPCHADRADDVDAKLSGQFHGPKRVAFVLAAMFAAMTIQLSFANAQQNLYGAIDSRVVHKSQPNELVLQAGAKKFGSTILALDSSPTTPPSLEACDSAKKHTCEELVQDNILWRIEDPENSASKHWQQKNLDDLCACTADPYATVNCFQIQVNNHRKSWQEGIATCRAKP